MMPAATSERDADRRIECYVRESPAAVTERVQSVCERLQTFREDDVIAEYQCKPWPPDRGSAGGATDGTDSSRHEMVSTLETWAERRDCTLEPAFRRESVTPIHAPESTYDRIRVPLITLLVYEQEELVGVAPCSDGDHVHTVDDCLTALETGGNADVFHAVDNGQASPTVRSPDG
jgi:hypothetical protein